jgi:hypothetical protein
MNPEAVTAEIDGWFLERGFVCKPGLGKLYRATADAGSLPLARSIRVVEIDQGDVEIVASRPRRHVHVAG